jgi:Tfp pilus assembly protein PilV
VKLRSGITIIHVLIALAVVLAIGSVGWRLVMGDRSREARDQKPQEQAQSHEGEMTQLPPSPAQTSQTAQPSTQPTTQAKSVAKATSSATQNTASSQISNVTWQLSSNGWQPMGGTPPACPDPLNLKAPADLSLVTGILYPGQTRGGNYKPHGGFRFDNQTNNDITVTAPLTAQVVRGGRYLLEGELQYTFDFITPCGIMYRVGHFLKLPAKFQAMADQFPPAAEGDSRTNYVNPPVTIQAGEVLATAVGVTKDTNVFFDWGVYDLRKRNTASQDATWASKYGKEELAPHALCWFDLLSTSDAARVKSLPPGDPTSGKDSDYCK